MVVVVVVGEGTSVQPVLLMWRLLAREMCLVGRIRRIRLLLGAGWRKEWLV